jgi:hypothetical protein
MNSPLETAVCQWRELGLIRNRRLGEGDKGDTGSTTENITTTNTKNKRRKKQTKTGNTAATRVSNKQLFPVVTKQKQM